MEEKDQEVQTQDKRKKKAFYRPRYKKPKMLCSLSAGNTKATSGWNSRKAEHCLLYWMWLYYYPLPQVFSSWWIEAHHFTLHVQSSVFNFIWGLRLWNVATLSKGVWLKSTLSLHTNSEVLKAKGVILQEETFNPG